MTSWTAEALNTAPNSDNKIHGDTLAKRYGFEGGLVPGVTISAYLVHPAIELWKEDWLDRGFANCCITSPLYDKETFTVDIDDSNKNRLNTTLVRSNGVVSANAEVSITSELPYPPIRRGDLVANKDYRPPEATMAIWKNLQKEGCRAFRYTWGGNNPLIYLKDSKNLPELLQPELGGFSNLSFLLGCSNWVLAGNGYMNAWLHLQTISQNYRSVKIGTDLIAEMKVNDVYAKKGHEFVDVAVDLYDEKDDECVMTINLIAIFKLRGM